MKAKRRQELKTNDLAQAIEDLREGFQDWGVYVIGAISAVIVIAAIVWYINDARAAAKSAAYVELSNALSIAPANIRKSDEEIQAGLSRLADFAEDNGDEEFKLQAAYQRANLALQLSVAEDGTVYSEYLELSADGFQTIIDEFKDRALYHGRALFGLFQVEANRFVLDQDPTHQANARRYLESLRDDSRLVGTPLVAAAIDRLNALDRLFTPIKMQAPPPTPLLPPDESGEPAATDDDAVEMDPNLESEESSMEPDPDMTSEEEVEDASTSAIAELDEREMMNSAGLSDDAGELDPQAFEESSAGTAPDRR